MIFFTIFKFLKFEFSYSATNSDPKQYPACCQRDEVKMTLSFKSRVRVSEYIIESETLYSVHIWCVCVCVCAVYLRLDVSKPRAPCRRIQLIDWENALLAEVLLSTTELKLGLCQPRNLSLGYIFRNTHSSLKPQATSPAPYCRVMPHGIVVIKNRYRKVSWR